MSELSESARNLAIRILERDYLIGQDVVLSDEQLRGMLANMQVPAPALLEIASAALELSGFQVEYEDRSSDAYRCRSYKGAGVELYQVDRDAPEIEISGRKSGPVDTARTANALLHAARTAREWASEGGKS